MTRDRTPGQRALRDLYFNQQEAYFAGLAENAAAPAIRQNAQQQVEAVQADRDAARQSEGT
jgi:hypothetical protein